MVSQNRIQRRTAEQIVDMPVLEVVEVHVESAKVSSRDRVPQCFEEQGVGRERISERVVEQVVDVPARKIVEVSQYPKEVLRKTQRQARVSGRVK